MEPFSQKTFRSREVRMVGSYQAVGVGRNIVPRNKYLWALNQTLTTRYISKKTKIIVYNRIIRPIIC